jgi:hypothetical protein
MTERFKKPTDEQIIELAILIASPKMKQHTTLIDMIAYGKIIVERLYDTGDITLPSKLEKEHER